MVSLLALCDEPHAAIGEAMLSTEGLEIDNRSKDVMLRTQKPWIGLHAQGSSLVSLADLSPDEWVFPLFQQLVTILRFLPQVLRALATQFNLIRVGIALLAELAAILSPLRVRPL